MHRLFLSCFALSLLVSHDFIWAQDVPASQNFVESLQYSRVRMPREEIATKRGYLPIPREQFDALIGTLEQPTGNLLTSTRIQYARYEARFSGGALIDGMAELDVVNPKGELASLALTPSDLPVRKARCVLNGR